MRKEFKLFTEQVKPQNKPPFTAYYTSVNGGKKMSVRFTRNISENEKPTVNGVIDCDCDITTNRIYNVIYVKAINGFKPFNSLEKPVNIDFD